MGSVSIIILSMKLFLMSAGVLSLAARVCVIPITVKERAIPKIWSVIIAWSKPPYLFIVFNFIIITIAATSCFSQQSHDHHHHPVADLEEEPTVAEKTKRVVDFVQDKGIINICVDNESCEEADDEDDQVLEVHLPVTTDGEENYSHEETYCYDNNYDYGKHQTIDNTWKMITGGERGHVPGSTAEIRREISPGQEELNRRVEEFIKKINQDMRLERQRSLEQYMQMIYHLK